MASTEPRPELSLRSATRKRDHGSRPKLLRTNTLPAGKSKDAVGLILNRRDAGERLTLREYIFLTLQDPASSLVASALGILNIMINPLSTDLY